MIGAQVQKAIYDALMVAPAIAGGKVYDRVDGDPFPRVTIGDEQILDDGNTCDDGWEVYSDIHVWSRYSGRLEAKQIMAQVVERVLAISSITGFTLIASELDNHRIFTESDGLTTHGVITIRFVINPA